VNCWSCSLSACCFCFVGLSRCALCPVVLCIELAGLLTKGPAESYVRSLVLPLHGSYSQSLVGGGMDGLVLLRGHHLPNELLHARCTQFGLDSQHKVNCVAQCTSTSDRRAQILKKRGLLVKKICKNG